MTLNETQYHGDKKIQLVGYESYCRNRTNKGGGGIATAVNEAEAVYALKVHEGVGDDEIVITRHEKYRFLLILLMCMVNQKVEQV